MRNRGDNGLLVNRCKLMRLFMVSFGMQQQSYYYGGDGPAYTYMVQPVYTWEHVYIWLEPGSHWRISGGTKLKWDVSEAVVYDHSKWETCGWEWYAPY
jgi:hypothetical protein